MIHAEDIDTANPVFVPGWGGDSQRRRFTSKETTIAIDLDARIAIIRPLGSGKKKTIPLENVTSWTDLETTPAQAPTPPPAPTPAPQPLAAQVAPKLYASPVSPSPAPSPPAATQSPSATTARPAATQPAPRASRSTRQPR